MEEKTRTIIVTTIVVLILVGAGFTLFYFTQSKIAEAKQEGALEFAMAMYTHNVFPVFSEGGDMSVVSIDNVCNQLNQQGERNE